MNEDLEMIPSEDGKILRFYKKHTVSYVGNDGKVRLLTKIRVLGDKLFALTPYKVENGKQLFSYVTLDLYKENVEEITSLLETR